VRPPRGRAGRRRFSAPAGARLLAVRYPGPLPAGAPVLAGISYHLNVQCGRSCGINLYTY